MAKMMKCFVMHSIGKFGVIEKPVPRPGPGDAIIRTTAALICTDWRWRGETAVSEPESTS